MPTLNSQTHCQVTQTQACLQRVPVPPDNIELKNLPSENKTPNLSLFLQC